MKMRLAIVALLATSTSAFAADLARNTVEPAAPIEAPVASWTGFYAGVHGGAAFASAKLDYRNVYYAGTNALIRDKFDNTGFIGGGHVGYNHQFDSFVLGVETDIDYTSLSKSLRHFDSVDKFESQWQGSLRARAGYAIDNVMPYITAGLAYGQGKFSTTSSAHTGLAASSDKTLTGWTLGGGLEYAVTPNWLLRGEVRYTDFGKNNVALSGDLGKANFDQTSTTLGVSYKF